MCSFTTKAEFWPVSEWTVEYDGEIFGAMYQTGNQDIDFAILDYGITVTAAQILNEAQGKFYLILSVDGSAGYNISSVEFESALFAGVCVSKTNRDDEYFYVRSEGASDGTYETYFSFLNIDGTFSRGPESYLYIKNDGDMNYQPKCSFAGDKIYVNSLIQNDDGTFAHITVIDISDTGSYQIIKQYTLDSNDNYYLSHNIQGFFDGSAIAIEQSEITGKYTLYTIDSNGDLSGSPKQINDFNIPLSQNALRSQPNFERTQATIVSSDLDSQNQLSIFTYDKEGNVICYNQIYKQFTVRNAQFGYLEDDLAWVGGTLIVEFEDKFGAFYINPSTCEVSDLTDDTFYLNDKVYGGISTYINIDGTVELGMFAAEDSGSQYIDYAVEIGTKEVELVENCDFNTLLFGCTQCSVGYELDKFGQCIEIDDGESDQSEEEGEEQDDGEDLIIVDRDRDGEETVYEEDSDYDQENEQDQEQNQNEEGSGDYVVDSDSEQYDNDADDFQDSDSDIQDGEDFSIDDGSVSSVVVRSQVVILCIFVYLLI